MTEAERTRLLGVAKVTEEELMEYADGVLAMPRRPEVRDALTRHPDLVRLLESYLFAGPRLAQIYNELVPEPDPERYLGARQRPAEQPPGAKPRGRFLGRGRPGTSLRSALIAAAATLVVVAGGGWLTLRDFTPPDRQGAAAFPSLRKALDSAPSGQSAQLGEHLSIQPQLTFYSERLGRWCREYALVYGRSVLAQAQLACRDGEGVWRVRDMTETVVVKDSIAEKDRTDPAGQSARDVLAVAREDLQSKSPLGPQEERKIIANNWRDAP